MQRAKLFFALMLLSTSLIALPAMAETIAHKAPVTETKTSDKQPEKIFLVHAYRYEAGKSDTDSDIGQSLCGTRCNALSVDYRNYTEPPGWRIIRIASNKEVPIELNNPFLDGRCVCVADEYIVKVNELYMSK